jgi:hypothetical protein
MILYRPEHDYLPYWKSKGVKFYSKLQAAMFASRHDSQVSFHFNDEILDCHDWSREPAFDIDHYYKLKAQELRDRYDYLVIMYSGGADSSTILKTFLKNRIPVDEVATYGIWNKNSDRYFTLDNLEIVNSASNVLNQCSAMGIQVRHLNLLDGIHKLETQDWIWESDPSFSASQAVRFPIVYDRPELKRMVSQGKRVAVVIGHDKPRVLALEDGLYFALVDMAGIGTGIFPQFFDSNYQGPTLELFFTNAQVPEIMIKQAHMIANWYWDNYGNHCMQILSPSSFDQDFFSRAHNIIYPTTWVDSEIYTIGKGMTQAGIGLRINPNSLSLHPAAWRSDWLYNNLGDTVYNKNWQKGVNHALSLIDDRFKDNNGTKMIGTWAKMRKLMDYPDLTYRPARTPEPIKPHRIKQDSLF